MQVALSGNVFYTQVYFMMSTSGEKVECTKLKHSFNGTEKNVYSLIITKKQKSINISQFN